MGRRPWARRLLVESCQALDVADLHQVDLFKAEPGTPCTVTWRTTQPVPTLNCWLIDEGMTTALRLRYHIPGGPSGVPVPVEYEVGVVWTGCYFGGSRPWLLCPGLRPGGLPCRRRARKLFLPPGARRFACRQCWDLTYGSSRRHDPRLSQLLRRPTLLDEAFKSPNIKRNLLAIMFLAGTDTTIPFIYPGVSVHDELGLFVQAGLTPLEALQTATINPARFLGLEQSVGTVQPGRLASLVLLNADPLRDIHNTTKIVAVIIRGKLLSRSDLDGMLKAAETAATK